MDRISELSDELLVTILSFVPTKVAVSTSILSKRWEFLWMWVRKLKYNDYKDITDTNRYRDFINKNLPLHRARIIESLSLEFCLASVKPEDVELWVGIAVARCLRELKLSIVHFDFREEVPDVALPSSLYTSKSLVTLELVGEHVLVDVPRTVCFPCLKTLQLTGVTYVHEDSLRLLLSYCPVLEDLVIELHKDDNVKGLVVIVKLSLCIDSECSSDGYVIVTPSLKYFKIEDCRDSFSYLIKHMPELEEAVIVVEKDLDKFLESITSIKRLSLQVNLNNDEESMYRDGIVFDRLEHLKLSYCSEYWSKLLFRLLKDSPKLRVLSLDAYVLGFEYFEEFERISWGDESSVPKCLLETLQTFKFVGYSGETEERDFLSLFFKLARCLKSTSILRSFYA